MEAASMAGIRVTILPNGLISVFDYGCKWAACYKFNGTQLEHHSGGTDHVDYRRAIASFLAGVYELSN